MARKIRVLVFEMPRMLKEIVTDLIAGQSDMEPVRSKTAADSLATAVDEATPDVVVLACDWDEIEDIGGPALARRPDLKILALTAGGRTTAFCALRPHTQALGPATLQKLAETIREVASS